MTVSSRHVAARFDSSRLAIDAIDVAARSFVRAAASEIDSPIVLAVSGGCDSMVLMHAVARALADSATNGPSSDRVTVATFDHGTGTHATRAAALVVSEATRLGFHVRAGVASMPAASEAEWRIARWRFLRSGPAPGSIIATAHTRDDQLETIVMRILRGAGARGLAGLAARTPGVARPFLDVRRDEIRRYANDRNVQFVDDPSNASRDHLRNRIRLDLLPAIRRVRPGFDMELVAIAEQAADWRNSVEAIAGSFVEDGTADGVIRVARAELAAYDTAALCVLWPAIAARALVTLDRRGTLRLAQFTSSGTPGARIQVSGGVEVFRHRDSFVVRRGLPLRSAGAEVPLSGEVEFHAWRFQPIGALERHTLGGAVPDETPDPALRVDRDDPWMADLPGDAPLTVREWIPADRMRANEGGSARRVKRFFGDAHIPGPSRAGWPVVLAGDEIVWIPGVRRSVAAPERSGRPVVRYVCERNISGRPNR